MPDARPVLEYRRPAPNSGPSGWRVLGGIFCVAFAVAMLVLTAFGGVVLILVVMTREYTFPPVLVGSAMLGMGVTLTLTAIQGARASFQPVSAAAESHNSPAADEGQSQPD